MALNFNNVTDELINKAAAINDLDEAVKLIQDAIGQPFGDTAGIAFSGGGELMWANATINERKGMLADYIRLEKKYDNL